MLLIISLLITGNLLISLYRTDQDKLDGETPAMFCWAMTINPWEIRASKWYCKSIVVHKFFKFYLGQQHFRTKRASWILRIIIYHKTLLTVIFLKCKIQKNWNFILFWAFSEMFMQHGRKATQRVFITRKF